MIALITGINGFVGPHLREELSNAKYKVYGVDKNITESQNNNNTYVCDLTDSKQIEEIIAKIRPEYIFHLAGFSSVGESFKKPELCHNINVNGTRNLLDGVVKAGISPRILIVSSSEIYGKPRYLPIDENHPINPISPYGISRVKQEELVLEYDLNIIIARSFNHTGPNQQETFVIPSFRAQIANAPHNGIIKVGNLEVSRDFSDVRDVVKAYRILAEKGESKQVYNVGSGRAYSLKHILNEFITKSEKNITVEIDPERYRAADIAATLCDNSKLQKVGNIKFEDFLTRL
jgi:GDP-4-dehydro-6-deoxy-D-mannose reductase